MGRDYINDALCGPLDCLIIEDFIHLILGQVVYTRRINTVLRYKPCPNLIF